METTLRLTDLRGARMLVTGGSGLLGSHLCELLIQEGVEEVIVLDNFLRGRRAHLDEVQSRGRLRIEEGSVTDQALVAKLVDGVDYVCHLAALRLTRCAEDPEACFEMMVRGTHGLLQAAAQAHVRKIIYASSVVVYGEPEYLPIDERHPLNSSTLYGAAKIAGEQFCRAWYQQGGLPYVVLRYFNMYGPRMSLQGPDTEVMIKWLDALEAGRAPVIHGDGSSSVDLVHVRDAAWATSLALRSLLQDEIINVASGQETTLKELLGLLMELTDVRVSPRFEAARAVHAGARRVGNPEKAKRLLGFEPRIGLRDGLQELIGWSRQQKRGVPARP